MTAIETVCTARGRDETTSDMKAAIREAAGMLMPGWTSIHVSVKKDGPGVVPEHLNLLVNPPGQEDEEGQMERLCNEHTSQHEDSYTLARERFLAMFPEAEAFDGNDAAESLTEISLSVRDLKEKISSWLFQHPRKCLCICCTMIRAKERGIEPIFRSTLVTILTVLRLEEASREFRPATSGDHEFYNLLDDRDERDTDDAEPVHVEAEEAAIA